MKLITWNIQWALGMDGRVDPSRVIRHAREMGDFDVLCLQEVADNFPELTGNDDDDQFATFARLLPDYTAVDGVALDIPGAGKRRKRFGNIILSRYPVAMILRHLLPWEGDTTRNMPRLLIEAVVMAPFGPLRIMTTHLEYSSAKLRSAQVEGILDVHRSACDREEMQREDGPGTYVRGPSTRSAILTGDFNMKPDDPTKRRLSDPISSSKFTLIDAWATLHPEKPHPPSFCLYDQTYGPPHCCDYIFVTQDLIPRVRQIEYDTETKVSDHQPVIVELTDK
ncbi:endonuclease/exonuclease/phosphatase family protein [Microvirga splendida]|uniref:Endonuclease/exonuclease/phosphatase family protein n=1 Tax=Microvirga splendida TaxID=2795727 RepID=A0ABS0Y7H1_9HYPH|nr:endonuclease/exonuclease/phosphatase family protein [Microvirga splendida]MBJ6128262.1 endonuclease/exonuclease/phosphatase family protein [Microvirga splendida]